MLAGLNAGDRFSPTVASLGWDFVDLGPVCLERFGL